jgi:hypothetical protein
MHSVDNTEIIDWAQQRSSSRAPVVAAANANTNSSAAGDARHSVDTYEDSLAPAGGYEGADAADDALCRPDSPLCTDPSHSVDSTEVIDWSDSPDSGIGQQKDPSTAAAASAGSPLSGLPADTSSLKQHEDAQQQQQRRNKKEKAAQRPYMNIVGGRWVPPSREESEAMMRGSYEMGPDEGV